jgi:hypothetical protein
MGSTEKFMASNKKKVLSKWEMGSTENNLASNKSSLKVGDG